MADTIIKPNEKGQFIVKMKVGGQEKDMQVDSGYNGRVFVDADNFKKITGGAEGTTSIKDATGKSSPAKTKDDVEIEWMGVKVKKRVTGLAVGGTHLLGTKFFPNLAGKLNIRLDLVHNELVVSPVPEKGKKVTEQKYYFVKVPLMIPAEDVFISTAAIAEEHVPFVVPPQPGENGAHTAEEQEEEHVPFVVPPQPSEDGAHTAEEQEEEHVPFVVPPQTVEKEIEDIRRLVTRLQRQIDTISRTLKK